MIIHINIRYHDHVGDYTESDCYAWEYVATSLKVLVLSH